MKKKNLTLGIVFLGLTIIALFGCKKEETDEEAQQDAVENFVAGQLVDEAADLADQVTMDEVENLNERSAPFSRLGPCVTITHDTTVSPRTILVDYGINGCLCRDGKIRKGAVLITYSGRPRVVGTVITLTPQNYFVNNFQLSGLKTFTNVSANGTPAVNIKVVNGQITNPQGQVSQINTDITRKFIAGYSTITRSDDVFETSGSRSRVNFAGRSVTITSIVPIVREMSCRWIGSGEIEIAISGRRNRVVNFGNGTCDDQATVTVGRFSRTITLP